MSLAPNAKRYYYPTTASCLNEGNTVLLMGVEVQVKEIRQDAGGRTIIWEKDGMSYGVTSCRFDKPFVVVSDN